MPIEKIEEDKKVKRLEFLEKILNSNLFIWFLSSIIISGGAALYNNSQHRFELESARQKELTNCQFEIVNRLNSMIFLSKRAKTMGDMRHALSSMRKSLGPVISEYENVNIAALYFKIYQITGVRNKEIGETLIALEEWDLLSQVDDPTTLLKDADKNSILELIYSLKKYEDQQIDTQSNKRFYTIPIPKGAGINKYQQNRA